MARIRVLYFCSPPLLDYSIEQINDLKQYVDLHVVVWVALHSPNHTILKLMDGCLLRGIHTLDAVKEQIENADLFTSYFQRCSSVHFLFFPANLDLSILGPTTDLLNLTNEIDPQIIHLDDISGRLLPYVITLKRRRIVLNIHDPAPHSGEANWLSSFIRKIIFRKIAAFCTFSNFSRQLFLDIYRPHVSVVDLRLVPYYSYSLLEESRPIDEIKKSPGDRVLLFFGRISPYKGIDELLAAFSRIQKDSSTIRLVIAGTGTYAYKLPASLQGSSALIVMNRFIATNEIRSLFEQADVVVCPYRDATQSGVLMTAAAFDLPAIVSNAGSLPEYIEDGLNGYVYDLSDESGLENAIQKFLSSGLEPATPVSTARLSAVSRNSQILLKLYASLIESS